MMRLPTVLLVLAAFVAAGAQIPAEKALANYKTAYLAAKKRLAATPKDKKVRAAFVVAGDRYATATMTADSLPPRTKYRDALRLYREVLKVDPKNREAANNSKMIIDIYKSMGRPVPQ